MSFKGPNPPTGSNPGSPSRSRRSSSAAPADPIAFTGINNSAARAEAALAFARRPRQLSNANRAAALAANERDFLNSIPNTPSTRKNNQANLRALANKYNGTRRRGRPLSNNALAKKLAAQRIAQANMLGRVWNLARKRT